MIFITADVLNYAHFDSISLIIIIIKYLYSASILKVQKRLTRATQLL